MRVPVLVLAALACACGGGGGEPAAVRVVLVSLDTLRGDHFTPERMPLTMARARAGRRFTRHYSATSTTQPTHATVFTGLLPWQHGVARNGLTLGEDHATLAEKLSAAGFETRAVVASYPLDTRFGFAQGFDAYEAEFQLDKGNDTWGDEKVQAAAFYSLGDHVTDRALAALDAMQGPRQFLFVHYFDAHGPYGDSGDAPQGLNVLMGQILRREPTAGTLARLRELYAQDVAFLDRQVERLLARLEQDAARVPTHVIVFSDHGESLGEDGWLGHGKHLSPEQIRVPLFVLSPRVPAEEVDTPVGSLDVFATSLALAGLPQPVPLGRDLSARTLRPAPVMGMRRTFVAPYRDLRLDGQVRRIEGELFYLVDGDAVYLGDARGVIGGHGTPQAVPAQREQRLLTLFGRFSDELDGELAGEVTDAEVQAALEALGYAR